MAEAARYPSEAAAHEHALVVLAMERPCWVQELPDQTGYSLEVEEADQALVTPELAAYDQEQTLVRQQKPATFDPFEYSAGLQLYGVWLLALLAAEILSALHPWLQDAGASSSLGLWRDGEWWRPLTALFLHADLQHLGGNALAALCFAPLVCRQVGVVRGWGLILLCGTLANAATSWIMLPEPYESIGASTATFAALGLLSGLGLTLLLRHGARLTMLRQLAPVIAGVILLGMLGSGSGDGRTDVLAHCVGYGFGLVAGTLHGLLRRRPQV